MEVSMKRDDALATGCAAGKTHSGAYEALFVGVGHDDAVMQQLGEAAHRAAASAVRTQ